MKLSKQTVAALGKLITGDKTLKGDLLAPYLSGPMLIDFFKDFGFNDSYQNFGTRWRYVDEKIRLLEGKATLRRVIEASLDPRRFVDSEFDAARAVAYLNTFLAYDGYEVVPRGKGYGVRDLAGDTVTVERSLKESGKLSHEFLQEQIEKCDRKIAEGDYAGAITNARSLTEGVLIELEETISGTAEPYDGDLMKLFKRVQKLMNLDPNRTDISEAVRQVLRGLVSVVSGLAPMRNMMSDAHATSYRPARHHAKLAANVAKTLVDFLFETFEFQKQKGMLSTTAPSTLTTK